MDTIETAKRDVEIAQIRLDAAKRVLTTLILAEVPEFPVPTLAEVCKWVTNTQPDANRPTKARLVMDIFTQMGKDRPGLADIINTLEDVDA